MPALVRPRVIPPRIAVAAVLASSCSGCVSHYALPSGTPTAMLESHMDSDSTSVTSTSYWMTTFHDLGCTAPLRVQSKLWSGKNYTTSPVEIQAGSPFVLSTTYMDSRFAQNRACIATVSFVPQAGRRYRSSLLVRANAMTCEMKVTDVSTGTEQAVAYDVPEHACGEGGQPLPSNGHSIVTTWQFTVQPNYSAPRKK